MDVINIGKRKVLEKQSNLIGGQRIVRNVFWNLLGAATPLLVGIFAIPILIEGLGTARFGLLTIAWMVVGYFSLFDFGLGRALTKLVAEKLGSGQVDELPSLIWTAMSLMAVLGVLGSVVVAALSPWLVTSVLNIHSELQSETLIAFYLLAASITIVTCTTGLRGILEAYQRFDLVNAVRIPLGIFTYLGPVAVLPISKSLISVVMVLVITRLVSCCVYAFLCLKVTPGLRRSVSIRRAAVMPLIRFGSWMTVSNIVSPLMVYMDRFILGTVVTMTAVAYYATPYEVVTKIWIISGALTGVLFPSFAAALVQDSVRAGNLFDRAVKFIFITLFPFVFIIVTFAYEGLKLWLGYEFASNSTIVFQLLAVGVFVNSLAHIPFGLVQAAGRPDITAKLHLIELPFYLLLLWWLIGVYGIVGAAIAWTLRATLDALFVFVVARMFVPVMSPFTLRPVLLACGTLLALSLGAVVSNIVMKWFLLLLGLPIFAVVSWIFILNKDERGIISVGVALFFRKRFKLR